MNAWNRTYAHADDAPSYPFGQWVTDGGALEPRSNAGGFAIPLDQDVPVSGERRVLHHKGNKATEVAFCRELAVAVVATRFAWVKDGVRLPSYAEGARGKLQALVYVQTEQAPALMMLTFNGLPTRMFSEAHKAFKASVRKAATAAKAKQTPPAYAFWMRLAAGEQRDVGKVKKSPVTELLLGGEADLDADYVGDDLVAAIEALLGGEAAAWRNAWATAAADDENGDTEESAAPTTPAPDWWRSAPLPKNHAGYATVGDAAQQKDSATLGKAAAWAAQKGDIDLANACREALAVLQAPSEEEIPF